MSLQGHCRRVLCLLSCLLILCLADVVLAKKKPPVHPINLNFASAAELQQVPGIGPSTADKILEMRKSYGAFKSVDDLLAIKGIGPKRLEKMRKYLTVGKGANQEAGHERAGAGTTECAAQSTARKNERGETAGEKQPAPKARGQRRRRAV